MEFKEHLKKYLTDIEIEKLLNSLEGSPKKGILLNTEKMAGDEFHSLYPNTIPHPIISNAFIDLNNEYQLGKSDYHDLGCFYLQEPSAMLPSFFLSPTEDDIVLDLCAAPGGKSVQASFLMNNNGLIISNDLSHQRAGAILENVERLGRGNIIITNNDFSKIYQGFNAFFDKIILDAPCSGSGMFRKEKKMEDDWTYAKVEKLASIQKELIMMSYSMLKEGGLMVYSTCSFSFEEDEEVIAHLLNNTDAEIVNLPSNDLLYVSNTLPYGVHTFPYLFPGEGHYICLIRKPGQHIKSKFSDDKALKKISDDIYLDPRLHHFDMFGDSLFALPHNVTLPKCLNIIRKGVKVGELSKNIFKYDFHYSRYVKDHPQTLDITEEEYKRYIKGDIIRRGTAITRGRILLIFNNKAVSFAKSDGQTIKNHYPKGLRK